MTWTAETVRREFPDIPYRAQIGPRAWDTGTAQIGTKDEKFAYVFLGRGRGAVEATWDTIARCLNNHRALII